jgi:hypothetical protein
VEFCHEEAMKMIRFRDRQLMAIVREADEEQVQALANKHGVTTASERWSQWM